MVTQRLCETGHTCIICILQYNMHKETTEAWINRFYIVLNYWTSAWVSSEQPINFTGMLTTAV